ncbi:uncharacterized protein LOC131620024 [Vicia villosa]|uniref:uncharacterized protein LOC131620024 n=1 Tax=Vicia villosa TaxID=3911 RepID=UPI00273C5324|nr:uncharacterized protein LOC131620024 [Vicia villosa]
MDSTSNKTSFERAFGHYVRVLVDIDLAKELSYKILVERVGFAFFVDIEYEKLPIYCNFCKFIGHSLEDCKRKKAATHKHDAKNLMVDKNYVPMQTKEKPKQLYQEVSKSKPLVEVETPNHNAQSAGHSTNVSSHNNNDPGPILDPIVCPLIPVQPPDPIPVPPDPVLVPLLANQANLQLVANNIQSSGNQSSDESEFVDATQLYPADPNAKFLEASWANLSERLDEAISDNDDDDFDPEQLKFHLVTSKSQKKKIRQKAKSKASYHTRSQSGTSKPF